MRGGFVDIVRVMKFLHRWFAPLIVFSVLLVPLVVYGQVSIPGACTTPGDCSELTPAFKTLAVKQAITDSGSMTINGTATLNKVATNGWSVNLSGQVFYFEGSSITRGYTLSGPELPGGGITGNYGNLLATSAWGSGNGTYYNDGVNGQTTGGELAEYSTGNSYYGVTVPSAHSLSPTVTGSTARHFYFLDLTEEYVDAIDGISSATSIANLSSLTTLAQSEGWFVVILTCPVITSTSAPFTASATYNAQIYAVNQAARNGTIPSNMVADMANWMPNQGDSNYYTDGLHPNANGHRIIAANLLAGMISGGFPVNYSGGFYTVPYTLAGGLTVPNGSLVVNSGLDTSTAPVVVNSTASGGIEIDSGARGTIGEVVKGYSGQTADLQDWDSSDGSVLTRIDNLGNVVGPSVRGTNGVTTKVITGACSDSNAQATDGTMCIDSTDGRVYFRYSSAWHYVAQTAGFQIPKIVRNGKDETEGLHVGDPVIGRIDEVMPDGSLHGVWEKFDLKAEIVKTLRDNPDLLREALAGTDSQTLTEAK